MFIKHICVTKYICVALIVLTIVSASNFLIAQDNTRDNKNSGSRELQVPIPVLERINVRARFIVALIHDGADGVWIGTEDEGIFHYQSDGKVVQYTTKNGLGDNNGYALAIDRFGRLWVGHLNTGVSVFNGKDWKNYDDGLIGERIFDIKVCPVGGDIWIATSGGISRHKIVSDEWEHFTREDGLLEDQVSSITFDRVGNLFAGTQCHGLAIFKRDIVDNNTVWKLFICLYSICGGNARSTSYCNQ